MDALFPLKIDIPDISEKKESSQSLLFYLPKILEEPTTRVNFLFTREAKIKRIKYYKNNIYLLGELTKNDKPILIYYIESFYTIGKGIEIEFLNNSVFIKCDNKKKGEESFLFNQDLFDKNNKKIDKLNIFDIYEEFEIYYRIHSEKKNVNSLKLLISSTLNLLKSSKEEANLTLFLALFIKEHSFMIGKVNLDEILLNMKNKGDLTKISNDVLYKIIDANKQNKKYIEIYFIYLILSQKVETIHMLLKDGCLNEQLIFYYLEKYKMIFSHSVQLFPKFEFLIEISNSFDKIKSILKCSNDLVDFIYFLNEEKEFIIKYIDKKNCLRIDDFFYSSEFIQIFDEDFYLVLDNLKQFEIKCNKNFLDFHPKILDFIFERRNIESIIFVWMIGEKQKCLKFDIFKYVFKKLKAIKNINSLNNFVIIEAIDILLNMKGEMIEQIIFLFKSIKFEKLNEKIKPFFSKMMNNIVNNYLENPKYYKVLIHDLIKEIKEKVNAFKRLDIFEYIFICIDKFIDKEKNLKEFNIEGGDIIDLINIISNKYLSLLNEIKNENVENEKGFFDITSKLIYLNYKFNIENEFLFKANIQLELLNDIYTHFLNKYEVSDLYFEKLISGLLKKGKLGKLYNVLITKKYFSKFENLLNKFIIEYDDLISKIYYNLLLVDNLKKKNFLNRLKHLLIPKKF